MRAPESQEEYLDLITTGLPPHGDSKRVLILGAGMAGLVAAHELLRAGHDPVLLEARNRVGGRIYTAREPFAPGLHAEFGAMRLPLRHKQTLAYVEQFELKTYPFTMANPRAYVCLHGKNWRAGEVTPEALGFELAEHERGKTPKELVLEAVKPLHDLLAEKGEDAWPEILTEYDQYSIREFLEMRGWSEAAIEMSFVLSGSESRLNYSFIEWLRGTLDFGGQLVQIEGGSDSLPNAFLPGLGTRVRFGARVTAIEQSDDDVTAYYQTLTDKFSVSADRMIVTIPFSVLRHIEVSPALSRPKQRAIRQINYNASTKIFVQCRRRFWEEDEGIHGGGTITDLAVRNIYYPEHGQATGRGVMLVCYNWGQDAMRWSALSEEQRIRQALENVAIVHPQITEEFEVGASHAWHQDPYAGGVGALFEPGQESMLHETIKAAEGRIHFAGDHTSLNSRWIQGAVESGLRAAWEVHSKA